MSFKKKFKPIKLPQQSASTLDLSNVDVNQDRAKRSICIYGDCLSLDDKIRKKCERYGTIEEITEERGGLLVTYSTSEEASAAVIKLHGKTTKNGSLIVCSDFAPPILISGHKPGIFIVRDVPNEISIPQLWTALKAEEIQVTHMSMLKTQSRHAIILCKEQKGCQALLEASGIRLNDWKLKVELWFEFCFFMTRRNVLLIENIPENSTETALKEMLAISTGIEFLEIIDRLRCALIYCKSKETVNTILACKEGQLKISPFNHVAGLRYMVFIDNLHETAQIADVHKLLGSCGNLLKVNLKLDQKTGLKSAVAYFELEESVDNALQLHGSQFLGKKISVSRSLAKKSNSIFITNLHRGASGLHLCLIFQDCGHIESVHVPHQKKRVKENEAGVVVFRDAESVSRALEKNNRKIRGLRIVVHTNDPYEDRGKRKKSGNRRKRHLGEEVAQTKRMKREEPADILMI